jgi:hypothetical protein
MIGRYVMIGTVKSRFWGWARLVGKDRDGSLYGSLLVAVASIGILLAVFVLSGCSGPGTPAAVDTSLARDSLKTALDHWKNGEDPKSLESSGTPMVAQDFEWASGAKLLDYEILDEKQEGPNLRVQVKIKLGPQGNNKAAEKKASYVVGTSPRVTVFRDVMKH